MSNGTSSLTLTPSQNVFSNATRALQPCILDSSGKRQNYEIPFLFDHLKLSAHECHRDVHILDVYDPSKFWLTLRKDELDVFNAYLYRYYFTKSDNVKCIPLDQITEFPYCTVQLDNGFFRSRIISCKLDENEMKTYVVTAFLIDIGQLCTVDAAHCYELKGPLLKVPQFAVRATLVGVRPVCGEKWRPQDATNFAQIVQNTLCTINIIEVDPVRRVVYVQLPEYGEKIATFSKPFEIRIGTDPNTVRYPFLFPDFDALENGTGAANLNAEFILNTITRNDSCYRINDVLYKCLNTFKENQTDMKNP